MAAAFEQTERLDQQGPIDTRHYNLHNWSN